MTTNKPSPIAGRDRIYEKIEKYLEDLIYKGKVKEGDRLISERELGKMFNASLIPVRRAMQKFVDRGILEKQHGRGTYVKSVPGLHKRTGRIGVLHCHEEAGFYNSTFYMAIMAGIDHETHARDKVNMIASLFKNGNVFEPVYRMEDQVDGFIMVDMRPEVENRIASILKELDKPVVAVNYEKELPGLDSIVFDGKANAEMLTEFLISRGHRRIAFIYAEESGLRHPNFLNRQQGYRAALRKHGLAVDAKLQRNFKRTRERSKVMKKLNVGPDRAPLWLEQVKTVRELLALPDPPTAFFCTFDSLALTVYDVLKKLGARIPDDVTVVGYNDILEASAVSPRLTTVNTPLLDMGQRAVKRLLEKIDEREDGMETVNRTVISGKIVERESHGMIPGSM